MKKGLVALSLLFVPTLAFARGAPTRPEARVAAAVRNAPNMKSTGLKGVIGRNTTLTYFHGGDLGGFTIHAEKPGRLPVRYTVTGGWKGLNGPGKPTITYLETTQNDKQPR
jgi:hypothetical protein